MNIKSPVLALCLLLFSTTSIAQTPGETVRETTGEIVSRLIVEKERLKKEPDYINLLASEIIAPHFDFVTMTHLILGSYWENFSWEERICITKSFRARLVERYSRILLDYDNHQISYEPPKVIDKLGYVVIRQVLTNEDGNVQVIAYPLRPDGDKWKVVDLIVEDVSLLNNYRAEYVGIINREGKDKFLQGFSECRELK